VTIMTSGATGEVSTAKANKAVIGRFVDEVYNERRLDLVDELFAPHLEVHTHIRPGPEGLAPGIEGMREMLVWIWYGWPDSRITLEDAIAEGDRVAVRFTFRGSHLGVLHGNPPSGRRAAWNEIFLAHVSDGKIDELWHELDVLGILQQIGAMPPLRQMGRMPAPLMAAMKLRSRIRSRRRGSSHLDTWREELAARKAGVESARR
jgi:predicted ester cyclase